MELFKRTVSGVALVGAALAALWAGSPWLQGLALLALAGAGFEWWRLCARQEGWAGLIALGGGPVVFLIGSLAGAVGGLAVLVLGVVLALALSDLQGRRLGLWSAGGVLYLGVPAAAVAAILADGAGGRDALLWLMVVIWATDIGAYGAGRLIGGPKLAPRISPKKTWAGLGGGLAAAAGVGLGLSMVVGEGRALVWALFLAVILGIGAQIGDLFASWAKRRFGVKDFGRLIPGHGGVLDRIDGLLAAAPLYIVATWLFGTPL
ncbi:MAG: phosphatidate cytidylyltransferase [Alphaproteobacteria bacterium]